MKRKSLWLVLLPALAVGGMAQESRQDISVSAAGVFGVYAPGTPSGQSNAALGGLVSYRYMLTPRSGLELNYQYSQTQFRYLGFYSTNCPTQNAPNCGFVYVHTRQQELSAAYVYTRTYGNFNPFVEAGPGGFVFSPIKDSGTSPFDAVQNTNIGVFYGAGVAYQITPSFDIRAEYRADIIKVPSFNITGLRTGIYRNESDPVVGIAYHF